MIMEVASKNLSKVSLELGGSNSTIIHHNSDINQASKKIIHFKFINCG
jgi:acyl-CoA reductase-like NAD-dependent aldehyde dehydrogenase